jgi:galactokinase
MATTTAAAEFYKLFNKQPVKEYFCPGWLNLLGAHTAQNGGLVISCAINMGTCMLLAPNNDAVLRFRSMNFRETLDILPVCPTRQLTAYGIAPH